MNGLPLWDAALVARAAGLRNAKILLIGDSTFAGYGASGISGYNNNAVASNIASDLASAFNATIPSQQSSFFGNGNNQATPNITSWDARMVQGAGWAANGTTVGGKWFQNNSDTSSLSFTPTQAFDTIDVYWVEGGGNGTFTVNVDGGATLATVNTSVSPFNLIRKTTISVPGGLTTHTINLQRNGVGGLVIFQGMDTYNSAQKIISVWNGAGAGDKSVSYIQATNPGDYLNFAKFLTPDLCVISSEINDWNALTSIATYTSQLQTIISACKQSGDVILVTAPAEATVLASQATQDQYNAAYAQLAASNNIPIMITTSIDANWSSYTAANAAGRMFDQTHPNGPGYANWASAIATSTLRY
jgi:lysophospholipase L1-like esterase